MRELLEKLGTSFDDGNGWFRIVNANWHEDDLRLNISIMLTNSHEPELWEIECNGVVEESLCSEREETFFVSSKSTLLKPYLEPTVELMFSKNELTPAFLLGVVCSSCVEVMQRSEFLTRFLNQQATVKGIVNSRYGLLGRFPESVAEHILEALKDSPIQINALPAFPPKKWNGSEFIDYSAMQVLQIGNAYVIAEKFTATQS